MQSAKHDFECTCRDCVAERWAKARREIDPPLLDLCRAQTGVTQERRSPRFHALYCND